ncbi:WbqC family protein [Caenimonas sedimenti]|uniref:WbqC family protein n=1 Tax=Caenimonas sedimenti TaxID=2596921 RepID=A0A562ZKU0_9BURK|nr:WbqC family protein [Caenimonas sedimenti]TWO68956.1 WbqC family protein [Caenimonas sedimenti]
MIVSIAQPAYLPWLGYFDRVAASDLHVVLDHVPLERSSTTRFTNRNKVRGPGGPLWLTVPVVGASRQPAINAAEIDTTQGWQQRHRRTLEQAYGKTPHFAALAGLLETSYGTPWTRLNDLLAVQRGWLLDALGIGTRIVTSSQLGVPGSKSELILRLCEAVGATVYLSGPFGRDYLDASAFERSGIALRFHDYAHPVYPQGSLPFEPYLSVVDLLAHHGADSLRLLRTPPE